ERVGESPSGHRGADARLAVGGVRRLNPAGGRGSRRRLDVKIEIPAAGLPWEPEATKAEDGPCPDAVGQRDEPPARSVGHPGRNGQREVDMQVLTAPSVGRRDLRLRRYTAPVSSLPGIPRAGDAAQPRTTTARTGEA